MPRLPNLLGALCLAVLDDLRPASSDAALVQLADHGRLTIGRLGRRLGLTHSAAVRMVAQLESRALVTRERADDDRRAVVLTLTPAGHAAAVAALAARASVLAAAVDPLPAEDRAELERLLAAILDRLPRSGDHATAICRLCDLEACPRPDCPVERSFQRYADAG